VLDFDVIESSSASVATAIAAGGPPPEPPEPPDIGDLYIRHRPLLLHIACRKFRVGETEAESLLQEVFLSFMTTTTKVENIKAWLVAAMCNASRHYWRGQGKTESLPENFEDQCDPKTTSIADQVAIEITLRQALDYLQPRCRDTLFLHYFEGRSAVDVAKELETTSRYAEKLIHNCLKRVREIYFSITAVKR